MAQFLRMPQATPTMTSGVLGKWAVAEGATLTAGSVVGAVETDKAAMDIEVFDKTTVLKLLAKEGDEVAVDAPIAILGNTGEDISALLAEYAAAKSAPAAAPVEAAPPAAPALAPVAAVAPPPVAAPAARPGVVPTLTWMGRAIPDAIMEPLGVYVAAAADSGRRIVASPLAKAIAADKGVALQSVTGSGPGGRIVAADVEAAAAAPKAATVTTVAGKADTTVRATQMRKTIARRLTDVHQQVPVFYLTSTFDASGFVTLKEQAGKRGIKISYNDLLLKAVAQALVDVPECNAAWQGESILRRGAVDISVAVALPEGLITPVIRSAETKSVRQIATEVRELAGRAKEGKLLPEEYTGGSFSVSNLGMFEIDHFTAILNPPEAGILAVGSVQQVPVVENGALTVGWRMKVTMTCDHRVIDGALGARFLAALRGYVELPAMMVL
jgi:pyruvate dehydrogenase E2 component (dihydrolipoamide acetyltransferase)